MSPGVSSAPSVNVVESDDSDDEGFAQDMDPKPVDPYRFSQATLEDTHEDELNAILGELSALQMSLDQEITKQPNLLQVPNSERNGVDTKTNGNGGIRTESPDNDSGFSDNASLLSSGSSLSASGSSSGSSTTSCAVKNRNNPVSISRSNNVIPESEDERAEKIRVALAKMRAASVTRLYVKAFSPDGSSKSLMVEESMSCGRVLALLADKNHVPMSARWALVECIPHLHMERIYEDHENMVENLLMWTRDSKNKIYFVEREEKYDMFINPQRYFLENRFTHGQMDDHTKNSLIEEFFNQGVGVPEVESTLYLKAEGKKAWKKFIFVLRASGIYYYPKGKSHSNSSKDLVCLTTIDPNQQAYQSIGWKKKFKAPTEYGFVLKPARLQVKSHRHIKYLCAEDAETLRLWMVGLRIAKFKRQIWDNYRTLLEDIAHEDLDRFGRSVSLASMPIQINTKDPEVPLVLPSHQPHNGENIYAVAHQQRRIETGVVNVPQTPTLNREEGFESDSPMGGTIKRKPSTTLQPKIPLTINTRSIVGDYIHVAPTGNEPNPALTHTLQRRRSSSGNSSTASSNSSLASINSQSGIQVQNNSNSHHGINGSGSLSHNHQRNISSKLPAVNTLRTPETVVEEPSDTIDFEDLPPPPPELLLSVESESPTAQDNFPTPPPPPPPPSMEPCLSASPVAGSLASEIQKHNLKPVLNSKPALATGSSKVEKKKGVSFASELTQRLQSRNANLQNPVVCLDNSNPVPTHQVPSLSSNSMQVEGKPKKLDEPPMNFMNDLQRVMQKKWQVAQKCHTDHETNPHEILGFRPPTQTEIREMEQNSMPVPPNMPPAPQAQVNGGNGAQVPENSLNNVRAWVSQHYGDNADELPPLQMQQIGATIAQQQQLQTQSQSPQSNSPMSSPVHKPIPPMKPIRTDAVLIGNLPLPPPPNNMHRMSNPVHQNAIYGHGNLKFPHPSTPPSNGMIIYENFQGKNNSDSLNIMNTNGVSSQEYAVQLRNKKPPPPIPKRSDSTHLSAHFVYN